MALSDDLSRIAGAATTFAADGEAVAAILVTEGPTGERTYLCAFEDEGGRAWLALDDAAEPVTSRDRVREAVSIAALHEIATDVLPDSDDGPQVRTLSGLDDLGAKNPDVAAATRDAVASVEELTREVERNYKVPLTGS